MPIFLGSGEEGYSLISILCSPQESLLWEVTRSFPMSTGASASQLQHRLSAGHDWANGEWSLWGDRFKLRWAGEGNSAASTAAGEEEQGHVRETALQISRSVKKEGEEVLKQRLPCSPWCKPLEQVGWQDPWPHGAAYSWSPPHEEEGAAETRCDELTIPHSPCCSGERRKRIQE